LSRKVSLTTFFSDSPSDEAVRSLNAHIEFLLKQALQRRKGAVKEKKTEARKAG
jgi:hypothetical protein